MRMRAGCVFVLAAGAGILCACGTARAQDAKSDGGITVAKPMAKDADPDWDVVTVHPSDPNRKDATFDVRGRHIIIGNRTVETMMLLGYGVQRD